MDEFAATVVLDERIATGGPRADPTGETPARDYVQDIEAALRRDRR